MISQIYAILQNYLGNEMVGLLGWFASEADYFLGAGYSEEAVVFAYVLIMGMTTMFLLGLFLYAIIQSILLLWKGVKNLL